MPILLAVPEIIFIAASISLQFRSSIFISAIFLTSLTGILATLVLFGSPLAFCNPAAFSKSTAAGGDFVIKVKVLSS